MVSRQASDLYIKTEVPPMLRIANQLMPVGETPLTPEAVEQLAGQLMQARHRKEFEERQQVNLAYHTPALGRYRANIYMQRSAPAIVIRRIKSEIPSFEELRLPKLIADLALGRRGLVLVAGPTGAGASTTLASMIDYRYRNAPGHVVYIEDHSELLHTSQQMLWFKR